MALPLRAKFQKNGGTNPPEEETTGPFNSVGGGCGGKRHDDRSYRRSTTNGDRGLNPYSFYPKTKRQEPPVKRVRCF